MLAHSAQSCNWQIVVGGGRFAMHTKFHYSCWPSPPPVPVDQCHSHQQTYAHQSCFDITDVNRNVCAVCMFKEKGHFGDMFRCFGPSGYGSLAIIMIIMG